jgi:hypothetical protein
METTMWRVKTYADGTKKKVCDGMSPLNSLHTNAVTAWLEMKRTDHTACGLYFNKTKKMRPKELWDHIQPEPSSSKRPASGPIRQSPRLSRTHGTETPTLPPPPESPSKRRRVSKPMPQPSPRMATRSSGVGVGVGVGRMEPFPFSSPATSNFAGFGTSPAVPLEPPHSTANTNGNGNGNGGIEDMDLDALLAQLTNATTTNTDTNGGGNGEMDLGFNLPAGINLEELFATVDNAARNDDALAEDMMKFLAGLEDQGQGGGDGPPGPGQGQSGKDNGNGNGEGNGNVKGNRNENS